MTVGWLDSPRFDRHQNGPGHPERPERLAAVRDGLAKRNLESKLDIVEPAPVTRTLLEKVHSPQHVAAIEALCRAGGGMIDMDTSVVEASWDAALRAAGALQLAVGKVVAGQWQRAFCSVRPPGHHAPRSRAMGFCLFDNVAVGAEAARALGVERVAILDWDVHHGNGTQDIFWDRGDVLFASWHQYPFYPGTGADTDTGAGAGAGTTVNVPVPAGGGDAAFMQGWQDRIRPALESFQPGLILISAGFDADRRDPLAGLTVTAAGYEQLSANVVEWAQAHCDGRVVSVLEGGYDLEALAEDVSVHVGTLL